MQTLEEIKQYLDGAITKWRGIRADEKHEMNAIAYCYIDAFQSIRVSIFGELLP